METASAIHMYTSAPFLSCVTDWREKKKSTHDDMNRKVNNSRINFERQDSNWRPWALMLCQALCTSQHNQKFELMEKTRQSTYIQNWVKVFYQEIYVQNHSIWNSLLLEALHFYILLRSFRNFQWLVEQFWWIPSFQWFVLLRYILVVLIYYKAALNQWQLIWNGGSTK
jgi:hypothetical protein